MQRRQRVHTGNVAVEYIDRLLLACQCDESRAARVLIPTGFTFTTVPPVPGVPVLQTPATGSTNVALLPSLTWTTVAGATSYLVQVSSVSTFASTVVNDSSSTTGSYSVTTPAEHIDSLLLAGSCEECRRFKVRSRRHSILTTVVATRPCLSTPVNAARTFP